MRGARIRLLWTNLANRLLDRIDGDGISGRSAVVCAAQCCPV